MQVDDISVGNWLTTDNEKSNDFNQFLEPKKFQTNGVPLKVIAINLPYILVEVNLDTLTKFKLSLSVKENYFIKLDKNYVNAIIGDICG